MSTNRKRPVFARLVTCLFLGLLVSGGLLMLLQQFYQRQFERSALREPYFILAGISALLITLFLLFRARKPWRPFKWLARLMVLAVLLALLWGGGAVYLVQNDFIYFPGIREVNAEAALKENPAVEELLIPGPDGASYSGYVWKAAPGRAGLILYFGGNGEPAAARVNGLIRQNAASLLSGYNFMMVDYPGYGLSGGEPTEQSITAMARAVRDYALSREDVDSSRLVLAGWSLGSGPASMLAADNQAAGLILMAPFYNGTELVNANLGEMAQGLPPFLSRLPAALVRNKYPNGEHAVNTAIPAQVIAAREDRVIPFGQAQRLEERYQNGEFVLIEGGHSSAWSDRVSLQAIASFLQRVGMAPGQAAPAP